MELATELESEMTHTVTSAITIHVEATRIYDGDEVLQPQWEYRVVVMAKGKMVQRSHRTFTTEDSAVAWFGALLLTMGDER